MNDKLREALEKAVGHFDAGQFAAGDAVLREALAASKQEPQPCAAPDWCRGRCECYSKQEPQAQEEPEVVAWLTSDGLVAYKDTKDCMPDASKESFSIALITLQSNREAMAEQNEIERQLSGQLDAAAEAIAQRDAALDACVGALEAAKVWHSVKLHEAFVKPQCDAAITQAKAARQ